MNRYFKVKRRVRTKPPTDLTNSRLIMGRKAPMMAAGIKVRLSKSLKAAAKYPTSVVGANSFRIMIPTWLLK